MENEYTQDDMLRMHEQAVKYARSMQEKAKAAPCAQTDEVESHEREAEGSEKMHTEKKESERQSPENPLSSLFGGDSDKALILPIIMLLANDNADRMLLTALMYIMA